MFLRSNGEYVRITHGSSDEFPSASDHGWVWDIYDIEPPFEAAHSPLRIFAPKIREARHEDDPRNS